MIVPGQVIVDADTTFRTLEGNAIEVSVVRKHGSHASTGVATLRGMTLENARRSVLVRVAAARAWQAIVKSVANEPAVAYEAARTGIEELGTEYRGVRRDGRNIMDDTGHSIRLAEMAAAEGNIAVAAADMAGVLQTRVDIYLRAFAGSVE